MLHPLNTFEKKDNSIWKTCPKRSKLDLHRTEVGNLLETCVVGVNLPPVPFNSIWCCLSYFEEWVHGVYCLSCMMTSSNEKEAGDLRRHHAHYDVTVMTHLKIGHPLMKLIKFIILIKILFITRPIITRYRIQQSNAKGRTSIRIWTLKRPIHSLIFGGKPCYTGIVLYLSIGQYVKDTCTSWRVQRSSEDPLQA